MFFNFHKNFFNIARKESVHTVSEKLNLVNNVCQNGYNRNLRFLKPKIKRDEVNFLLKGDFYKVTDLN